MFFFFFLTIPIQEKDSEKFAFTIPSLNNEQPVKCYQWRVLPQGMLNNPTLCQHFINQPLDELHHEFPSSKIIHYMDDILFAMNDEEGLQQLFLRATQLLPKYGLEIATEKVQQQSPYLYLGYKVETSKIVPQCIQVRRDKLVTLNDFQKLLGDINWLRPALGIPTYMLQNLFAILEGNPDLNSPRILTPAALRELHLIEQHLIDAYLDRIDLILPVDFILFPSDHSPTVILYQDQKILEWIFLPHKTVKKNDYLY